MSIEDDAAATHRFLATLPGYHGWRWAVVRGACPPATPPSVRSCSFPAKPPRWRRHWVPWEQARQAGRPRTR